MWQPFPILRWRVQAYCSSALTSSIFHLLYNGIFIRMNVRINMSATMNGRQIVGQYSLAGIRDSFRRKPSTRYARSHSPPPVTGRIYRAPSVAQKCKYATHMVNNRRRPSLSANAYFFDTFWRDSLRSLACSKRTFCSSVSRTSGGTATGLRLASTATMVK
jgi:hypothetical protein